MAEILIQERGAILWAAQAALDQEEGGKMFPGMTRMLRAVSLLKITNSNTTFMFLFSKYCDDIDKIVFKNNRKTATNLIKFLFSRWRRRCRMVTFATIPFGAWPRRARPDFHQWANRLGSPYVAFGRWHGGFGIAPWTQKKAAEGFGGPQESTGWARRSRRQ